MTMMMMILLYDFILVPFSQHLLAHARILNLIARISLTLQENCNENEVDSKAGIVNVANFNITTDSGCAKITNEVNNALVSNQEKSFAVPNIKEEPY